MAEVRVRRAGRDDQRVVGQRVRRGDAGDRRQQQTARSEIEPGRAAEHDADVGCRGEQGSQGICDVTWRERTGRDLVGQRLEEVKVTAIYERDVDVDPPQALCDVDPGEAAADDDHVVAGFVLSVAHLGILEHAPEGAPARGGGPLG